VRRQHQREDGLEGDALADDRLPAEINRRLAGHDLDLFLTAQAQDHGTRHRKHLVDELVLGRFRLYPCGEGRSLPLVVVVASDPVKDLLVPLKDSTGAVVHV
jgi:hypothetical protein